MLVVARAYFTRVPSGERSVYEWMESRRDGCIESDDLRGKVYTLEE